MKHKNNKGLAMLVPMTIHRQSERNEMTKGFTLVEILIIVGIILILFLVENRSSMRPQQTVSIETSIDTLTADIASQQNKSMTGDQSVGGVNTSYGVYFQNDSYVLFRGASYSPAGSDNFSVDLNPTFTFSTIDLPNSQLVFATGSGTLANYDPNQKEVVITDTVNNISKTLQLNSYGVVVSVQ